MRNSRQRKTKKKRQQKMKRQQRKKQKRLKKKRRLQRLIRINPDHLRKANHHQTVAQVHLQQVNHHRTEIRLSAQVQAAALQYRAVLHQEAAQVVLMDQAAQSRASLRISIAGSRCMELKQLLNIR